MQARRLVAPPKPARRFAGPILLAGLVLGLVLFLLFPRPAPAPPQPGAAAPAADDALSTAPAVAELQEGVPVQATAAPLAPSAPPPDPAVVNEQRLREAVFAPFRDVRGRYGIVVRDLATGHSVTLNEHYPFQSASLYKLPVMYEVFKQRDLDVFSLNEEMTIGADDAAMDLGSLPWPIGTRITIGTALERMVTLSDNSGAYMLAKKAGSGRINDDMMTLGLWRTYIRGSELQTSAYDMARLLEMIARGEALSPKTSAEMVHLMARQQVRDRIPVLMPAEATVANKTGNWEAAAHDVAIVYGPRATIVIAFLADGVGDFDGLYHAMATAARNVYDLANDPAFGSSATPSLPRSLVASYQSPARVPGSAGASVPPSTQTRTSAPAGPSSGTAAPAPAAPAPAVVQPGDKPRGAQPAAAPRVSAPSGPALAPAPAAGQPKPAERPAAPSGEPSAKPAAPSIFTAPGAPKPP